MGVTDSKTRVCDIDKRCLTIPAILRTMKKHIIQVITNSIITLLEYSVIVLTLLSGFPFKHMGSLHVNGGS